MPSENFLRLLEQAGLPEPTGEFQFWIGRKWRFDYAWPDRKIALEVEGAVWAKGRHTRPSGFLKDMEKYNMAAVLGWRVARCTPRTLCDKETISLVSALLTNG